MTEPDALPLRSAIESMLDPHVILQAVRDDRGAIVDFVYAEANELAAQFNQTTREGLIGRSLLTLHPAAASTGLLDAYRTILTSGEPLILEEWAYPQDMLAGAERIYDVRAVQLGPEHVSQTWRDVTDRVMWTRTLSRREREYRLLAENAGDVVLRTRRGIAEWVSPSISTVLGWHPDDLLGTDLTAFVHPEDAPAVAAARQTAAESPSQALDRLRFRVRTRVGRWRWVEMTSRAWVDDDGTSDGFVGTLRDVTDEVVAKESLTRSERVFRTAMESAPVGMAIMDLGRRFVQVNWALTSMLGRSEEWLVGREIGAVMDPHHDALDRDLRREILLGSQPSAAQEKRLIRSDGASIWTLHSVGLLRDDQGAPTAYISHFVDVTEARRDREELRFLASHDALTGVLNRRALVDTLGELLAQVPPAGRQLALMFVDVDHLKAINDTHGHVVGDRVLTAAADRIRARLSGDDLVARYGGDEFIVVMPKANGVVEASHRATSLLEAAHRPVVVGEVRVDISFSIGLAMAHPGDDPDGLLHRADGALYRAKRNGRGRTIIYDSDPEDAGAATEVDSGAGASRPPVAASRFSTSEVLSGRENR